MKAAAGIAIIALLLGAFAFVKTGVAGPPGAQGPPGTPGAGEVASTPAACAAHKWVVLVNESSAGALNYKCVQPDSSDITNLLQEAASSPSACATGQWLTQVVESSAGVLSLTCSAPAQEAASTPSACATHQWVVQVAETSTGVISYTCSQPGFSDLSGTDQPTWANIQSFPSGCVANRYVVTVGGTLTCAQPVYANLASLPFNASKGLVGYWSFNEAQGTSAYDYSGSRNTGTLTNTPTWVTGEFGSALNFASASSQYVTAGSPSNLQLQVLSIALWVKMTTNGATQTLLSYSSGSVGYEVYVNTANNLAWTNIASEFCSVAGISDTTTWHFVVFTYDGSTCNVFLDGALIKSASFSTTFSFTGASVDIGSRAGTTNFCNCREDDVRIYNYVLSAAQVKQLYNWVPGV